MSADRDVEPSGCLFIYNNDSNSMLETEEIIRCCSPETTYAVRITDEQKSTFVTIWRRMMLLLVISLGVCLVPYVLHMRGKGLKKSVHSIDASNSTVVCRLFTKSSQWESKGKAILQTWTRHCHRRVIFYSKFPNHETHDIFKTPDTVALDIPDGRRHLTAKTFAALNYSYAHYGDVADWFLKADDDVYVFWENLVWFLRQFNPSEPYYIGATYKFGWPDKFNSGGAGYLISKPTVSDLLRVYPKCAGTKAEDVAVSKCLVALKLYPINTKDDRGKHRFYQYRFTRMIPRNDKDDISNSFSKETISFHYTSPEEMYMFEYLREGFNRDAPS